MDIVSTTLLFMALAVIGGILVMPPEQIFAEEIRIEIKDGVGIKTSTPETNFVNSIILK